MTHYLGIDPGYAIIGWGIVDHNLSYIDCGAITTPAGTAFNSRILDIHTEVNDLITRTMPDAVAMEDLFIKATTNGILVAEARGVIRLAIAQRGLQLFEYSNSAIKAAATGDGKADKSQVARMVAMSLGLDEIPKPDDITDGLAAAITLASRYRYDSLVAQL